MIHNSLASQTIKCCTASFVLLAFLHSAGVLAQSSREAGQPMQLPEEYHSQNQSAPPSPAIPPDAQQPPRIIHRTGTAISTPRNSVSIKSTDAGLIHRHPVGSTCINCGVVDFVNKIGQGPGLNAIAGGIVAGTVAREIIKQSHHSPHSHAMDQHHNHGNIHSQYQVGVTMHDGSQAVIAVPEAAHFHQGDRVKLIDGKLIADH